jgi:hypothetical protein
MPPTGSIFTDWQQVDNERRLLMDEDFSWSDPPARARRRRAEAPARIRRRSAVAEAEPVERAPSGEVGETHSEFDEVMQRWNEAYGDASRGYRASRGTPQDREEQMSYAGHVEAAAFDSGDVARFDRDDVASYARAPVHEDRSGAYDSSSGYDLSESEESDRRTVVITGRGDDRYMPARRRPSSELRFHERSGFSPDRTAMWAVLLGLALLIGAVVH